MVTGPVNKAVINDAGTRFTGHTEYIAEHCGNAFPVMLLTNEKLRVALVTTHVALKDVGPLITEERLRKVLEICTEDLNRRFGISDPRILVCGLNPHAGEEGHLGNEETDVISPCLQKLREQDMNVHGPVPADTAFIPAMLSGHDLVVCMYHDQGLPVIKSQGFGDVVNVTLGLPIIRTSVDHGTALELAGSGKASSQSFVAAMNMAIDLVRNQSAKG